MSRPSSSAHPPASLVYKICTTTEWSDAAETAVYRGSSDDQRGGFIHLSQAHQLAGTLARHFEGRDDLVLIAFVESELGSQLRWEISRGGEPFPHLHGPLPIARAVNTWRLALDPNGRHVLPDLPPSTPKIA